VAHMTGFVEHSNYSFNPKIFM